MASGNGKGNGKKDNGDTVPLKLRKVTSDIDKGDPPTAYELKIYYRRQCGWTPTRIAAKYQCHRQTVYRICKKVAEYERTQLSNIVDHTRQLHNDIDYKIIEQSARAWIRSTRPAVSEKTRETDKGTFTERTVTYQAGNASFHATIGDALDRIEKREGVGPPIPSGTGAIASGVTKLERIRRMIGVLKEAEQIELANEQPETIVIEPPEESPPASGNGEETNGS